MAFGYGAKKKKKIMDNDFMCFLDSCLHKVFRKWMDGYLVVNWGCFMKGLKGFSLKMLWL